MNRSVLSIIMIGAALCCCNVKDSQQNGPDQAAGDGGIVVQRRIQSPAAFKQNVSIIQGGIDSVIIVDERNFRIVMRIFSSTPEEDIASFAETGQQITCTPEYFAGEGGVIDNNNNRNIKLMSLRGAKNGDRIKAMISMDMKGEWKIVEIIE